MKPKIKIKRVDKHPNKFTWPKHLADLLGKIPDKKLTRKAGISLIAVVKERNNRGIPAYRVSRKPIKWTSEMIELLGTNTDEIIAEKLDVNKSSVYIKRRALGIPAFNESTNKERYGYDWPESSIKLLGKMSDLDVAKELNISRSVVNYKRKVLGIPPCTPPHEKIEWTVEMIKLLGVIPDMELSRRFKIHPYSVKRKKDILGIPTNSNKFKKIARTDIFKRLLQLPNQEIIKRTGLGEGTILKLRKEYGIKGTDVRRLKVEWTPEKITRLGKESDPKIAKDMGINPEIVRKMRNKLNIPSLKSIKEKDNILADIKPLLAKEWHPTKNGNLTPKDFTFGSKKKVWWKCKKGHEWTAKIYERNAGNNCPYCSGKKANKDNCLATKNPELAKQWHPEKNNGITPFDVTSGSGKKVWWKCEKGHEWMAVIDNRIRWSNCPYCSGKKASKDNCLATKNPELAKQWHPEKNIDITPFDVLPGSNKKIWWKCEKGHEWETIIATRNKGHGCPFCARVRSSNKNSISLTHHNSPGE